MSQLAFLRPEAAKTICPSRRESLRRAQLDVLRHPEWVEGRMKDLAGVRGVRGLGTAVEVKVSGKKERRSPVAWWAAWQLSGDWR